MSKALEKIESLQSNLSAGLFELSSGNDRMDDLRTMIGQIKVAIKKDRQEDYDRCIKRMEEFVCSRCGSDKVRKRKFGDLQGSYPLCDHYCEDCRLPATTKSVDKKAIFKILKEQLTK